MEVIRELKEFYEDAKKNVEYLEQDRAWEKADYDFDDDPPCIVALLQHGVFQLGTINMAQMRLAAWFKIRNVAMRDAVRIMDEWVLRIPPDFIYEHTVKGETDYTKLKEQNKYICRTVYGSGQYGFSCGGIKQIPGLTEHCQEECRKTIEVETMVGLFDATRSEHRKKRISVIAECVGRQEAVLIIPAEVKAACTASRLSEATCMNCPLYANDQSEVTFTINAASPYILRFLEPSGGPIGSKIANLIGITGKCKRWRYTAAEQNAETVYIVPPITNEYSDSARYTRQLAYSIGHGIKTNQPYKMSGYVHVNEYNNTAVLVFDTLEETTDSLLEFERTPEMRKDSHIFVAENVPPLEKLKEIAESLAYNHIKIWGRENMIMAMDLAYHSVRRINFQDKILRGWLNVLIIGDSGQGKTEAIVTMMRHYNLGYKTSAESATRAGLLYGINMKTKGPSYLIWGAIPRYSGRLVVIDELKGIIKSGAFAELTEARSAGVVNVDTIVSGRALAETRLVMLTNPMEKRRMDSYYFPVEAVQDLIPDLEDTRRFDFVVGVASQEIADEVIHQNVRRMEKIEDIYTSEICRNHLLWVWNLKPEDIIIDPKVEQHILEVSLEMCKIYSSAIPIVEPADHREKVVRVAVAIAARLNAVETAERLRVRNRHVDAAFEFMKSLYDSDALKYDGFSDLNALLIIDSETMEKLVAEFKNTEERATYWRKMAWYMATEGYIHPRIMAASVGCEIALCTRTLDWLSAYRLCKMISQNRYVKTPNGVTFLRHLIDKETEQGGQRKLPQFEGGEEF